jgi:hypothetical protein
MSRVFATENFNVSLDRAYQFSLFYLTQLNPNPNSGGKGSISEKEMLNQFQKGQMYVLTEWEHPNHFVVARIMGLLITKTHMGFRPTSSAVEVTWEFSLEPTSFAARILTAIPKWRMARAKGQDTEARKSLLSLKNEVEHTDRGLEEAFLQFQSVLRQADQVRSQGMGLLLCSAFAYVMEEGSPDPTQKLTWKNIRNMTGIYGALHFRVLVPKEHVRQESQAIIMQALQELRTAFERGGARAIAGSVGLSLAWVTKAPKSLDQFEVPDGDSALLGRLLLTEFVPPTLHEAQEAAQQFGELMDVVDEAFSSWIKR